MNEFQPITYDDFIDDLMKHGGYDPGHFLSEDQKKTIRYFLRCSNHAFAEAKKASCQWVHDHIRKAAITARHGAMDAFGGRIAPATTKLIGPLKDGTSDPLLGGYQNCLAKWEQAYLVHQRNAAQGHSEGKPTATPPVKPTKAPATHAEEWTQMSAEQKAQWINEDIYCRGRALEDAGQIHGTRISGRNVGNTPRPAPTPPAKPTTAPVTLAPWSALSAAQRDEWVDQATYESFVKLKSEGRVNITQAK